MSPRTPCQVFKFGGTSVGSVEAIRQAARLVEDERSPLVVVVSAASGVTDALLGAARSAERGDLQAALAQATDLRARHIELGLALLTNRKRLAEFTGLVEAATHALRAMFESVAVLKELSVRSLDAILAHGERLSSRLFALTLQDRGRSAQWVDATAVVLTELAHGSRWPNPRACQAAAAKHLLPLLKPKRCVVVPGFIGMGSDGEVVTLGRGGSDFSAALIAASVRAERVVLWKEVDGLMTADPRRVRNSRVVPELHYREAAELAYYGAKVLHPRTMIPLLKDGIPLFVKNTFNPAFSGTRIAGDVAPGRYPVKALSVIAQQALVSIEGNGMMGVPGIAARTFTALSAAGHSVSMISQASSEASICFVVPDSESDACKRALLREFKSELRAGLIDAVRVEHKLAALAVVGLGMRGTPGIASRTFAALATKRINIAAIAQGSSELNITALVREAQASHALNALHAEFQLDKLRPLADTEGKETAVIVHGFGQIGRALVRQMRQQARYFRHDLGFAAPIVALTDRSGVVTAADGFSGEALDTLAAKKQRGEKLVAKARGKADIAKQLEEHVWSLPKHRGVLVDLTADETAPLLQSALGHGFHVVVANKKPLAVKQAQFDALFQAARAQGLSLRYEATVGAGLPVLDTLAKLREAGDKVSTVLGCLSGTLGYLMTQLEQGVAFSEAVGRAHALGFTEPDPREDLSGMDVGRKALILARTLGMRLDLTDIDVQPLFPAALSNPDPRAFVQGLAALDGEFAARTAAAKKKGQVLRYVARIGKRVTVGIEAVPDASPLGRLSGTDNQIVLHTKRYATNPLVVTGPGAGAEVTAAGVLNDIVAISMGAARRPG